MDHVGDFTTMGPGIQINPSKMVAALRAYKIATCKDEKDILNRAARNTAYRAASATPVASPSKIRRDVMRDPHLRYALTSIALRRKGIGLLKSPEFAKAVSNLVSRRASSAKYLRAGWAKAIQELGGTFRGSKFKGADGFANKATTSRLVTEIVNILAQPDSSHAAGAERIGLVALQQGLDAAAADMMDYARTVMSQTAKQHSG